jgi:tetratricopeptide (TPR) repeat protein
MVTMMIWLAACLALAAQEADAAPGEAGIDLTGREDAPRMTLDERLDVRLADLRAAETDEEAAAIADEVRSLWRQKAGPTADLLLQRGAEAAAQGDMATAERQYTHLRRLEPDFAEAWVVSAEAAAAAGDWPFALEALNTAIELEPRRFDAYAMLGQALEQADEPEAALAAYEEALRLYPRHERARSAQARLERRLAGRAL